MRILVVDDELDICEILQYNLETEGYEVTTANSAEEALQLPLQDFSLILLDDGRDVWLSDGQEDEGKSLYGTDSHYIYHSP